MAQTPAERRARRDAMAQARINPDTGMPFANYNALDTWQRNQKAKVMGFRNRYERRVEQAVAPVMGPQERKARLLPQSFYNFLRGRQPTEALARDFNDAFGRQPKRASKSTRLRLRALRARFSGEAGWSWALWRAEYATL